MSRQRRCPEVSAYGGRCVHSIGVDYHPLQRTTTGLGLPRLIHTDADGNTWLAATAACPHCGHDLDEHAEFSGNGDPEPGDVSICLYCRNLSLFDTGPGGLYLRKPTPAEYDEIAAHPTVVAAQQALAMRGGL
jgi:hypothetical protein